RSRTSTRVVLQVHQESQEDGKIVGKLLFLTEFEFTLGFPQVRKKCSTLIILAKKVIADLEGTVRIQIERLCVELLELDQRHAVRPRAKPCEVFRSSAA